jgi:hypothetical protein
MGKEICVPTIETYGFIIEADKNSAAAGDVMNEWGKSIPLIKVNDFLLDVGDVTRFSMNVGIGKLPTFSLSLIDDDFKIRESLSPKIDNIAIFLGYKHFYFLYNGMIDGINSRLGSDILSITGVWNNPLLLEVDEIVYKDMTITDILTDVCTKTKMGLYIIDNEDLSKTYDYIINPGMRYIDFIKWLITNYTYNFWSIDTNGYLHVGNYEMINKEDIAKYTLKMDGTIIPETPMLFTNKGKLGNEEPDSEADKENEKYLQIENYTAKTDYTGMYYKSLAKESIFAPISETLEENELETLEVVDFGVGIGVENTFSGFSTHKKLNYTDIINKFLAGNKIKIQLNYLVFEINPFDMVNLLLLNGQTITKEFTTDKENSGNKMITGFTIDYLPASYSDNFSQIMQTIELN